MLEPPLHSVLDEASFQEAFAGRNIEVIAPASGINPQQLEAIRNLPHLQVNIPANILQQDIPYHAASDEARFLQLKNALYDPNPETIIWILRGGYGSARLIDKLLELPKPEVPKSFMGCSDITALHLFLSEHWQWQTVHASGIWQLLDPNQDMDNFLRLADIVSHKKISHSFSPLVPCNLAAKQNKHLHGKLTGGNLTLVESSIGTPWQIQTERKILMLEDTGEKGYRIDRSLNHLKQAGLLHGLAAIVLGQFTHSSAQEQEGIAIALQRFANETDIPVYEMKLFGHGKVNYPWVYHADAKILQMDEDARRYVALMQR